MAATKGPYDTACFHAQQAVEKLLKAWLTPAEQPILRTHDVEELADLCTAHGLDPEAAAHPASLHGGLTEMHEPPICNLLPAVPFLRNYRDQNAHRSGERGVVEAHRQQGAVDIDLGPERARAQLSPADRSDQTGGSRRRDLDMSHAPLLIDAPPNLTGIGRRLAASVGREKCVVTPLERALHPAE